MSRSIFVEKSIEACKGHFSSFTSSRIPVLFLMIFNFVRRPRLEYTFDLVAFNLNLFKGFGFFQITSKRYFSSWKAYWAVILFIKNTF